MRVQSRCPAVNKGSNMRENLTKQAKAIQHASMLDFAASNYEGTGRCLDAVSSVVQDLAALTYLRSVALSLVSADLEGIN